MGFENVNNFNLKSGGVVSFSADTPVKTPTGPLTTSRLLLDNVGFYEINGVLYAVNLLNEKESDINKENMIEAQKSESFKPQVVKEKKEVELEPFIVLFAFIVILLELFYMKYIGEI